MADSTPRIAVIGGSGLYTLLDPALSESRSIRTPYGSVDVTVGDLVGRQVVFLPRHGPGHSVAPHAINYRGNVWALASLGVRAIVSSAAVGGLNPGMPPGTLVLPDQFIDRTSGRADTFYDRDSVQHLAAADPFCPELRRGAVAALGADFETRATVVVIQGPRFSTRAESKWFQSAGADLVNMTLYPEVPLAAELNIGTVTLAFVTDSDAAVVVDGAEDLSADLVFTRLREAQPRIVAAITAIVAAIDPEYRARELIAAPEVAAVLTRDVLAERP